MVVYSGWGWQNSGFNGTVEQAELVALASLNSYDNDTMAAANIAIGAYNCKIGSNNYKYNTLFIHLLISNNYRIFSIVAFSKITCIIKFVSTFKVSAKITF